MSHGYLFKAYAHNAPAGYIPSLIGDMAPGNNGRPAYFEMIEIADRRIDSMVVSRWVSEGQPENPILQCRHPKGHSYYIPKNELEDIAAENSDDDTFEMLALLFKRRVFP
jgi:hypothetical protein